MVPGSEASLIFSSPRFHHFQGILSSGPPNPLGPLNHVKPMATDAWTRRAPLPTPRSGIAASTVLLDGKPRIEVVGGIAPGNNVQYIP